MDTACQWSQTPKDQARANETWRTVRSESYSRGAKIVNSAAYLDASAITKLFIPEKDSEIAEEIIYSFEEVFTSRISMVEVQRAIALFYDGANRDSWITSFRRWLEDVTVIDISRDIANLATAVNQNGRTQSS